MAYDKIKAIKWLHIYKNSAYQEAMNFYGPNNIVSKMHKAKMFPVIQGWINSAIIIEVDAPLF